MMVFTRTAAYVTFNVVLVAKVFIDNRKDINTIFIQRYDHEIKNSGPTNRDCLSTNTATDRFDMGCVNVTYDETYQYEPGEGRPECLAACPVGSFNFTDVTPTSG